MAYESGDISFYSFGASVCMLQKQCNISNKKNAYQPVELEFFWTSSALTSEVIV
jgi:hypothetical protein